MTDAALIERFLEGDVDAFNMLVWRWEKPLYNFIRRNIGNEETAKDICQTAFIRIFKELKRLREPTKFTPWMYRIALNLCRDEYKRKKNRRHFYMEDVLVNDDSKNVIMQLPDQENKNPEEMMQNQQIGDILNQIMMTLPDEQRVVIVMKQYQGLKFTEIADILDQPINTIKSRLYYGLRSLKKILEESHYSKEVLYNEV